MTIISKNSISLELKAGKKWGTTSGFVMIKSVTIAGKAYPFAGLGKYICSEEKNSINSNKLLLYTGLGSESSIANSALSQALAFASAFVTIDPLSI